MCDYTHARAHSTPLCSLTIMPLVGERRERANLVAQLARFFYIISTGARPHTVYFSKSAKTAEAHAHSLEICHHHRRSFSQRFPYSWLQSILQPTWKAWMGLPHQQSVTQPVIARYVWLSASPAGYHPLMPAVNAFMQAANGLSTRSCVGNSALTRCAANINQDN